MFYRLGACCFALFSRTTSLQPFSFLNPVVFDKQSAVKGQLLDTTWRFSNTSAVDCTEMDGRSLEAK